jgi:hypothetical protein
MSERTDHQRAMTPVTRWPRVQLILHHHPCLDPLFLVRTIMELTRLGVAPVSHAIWEARRFERSTLLVGHRERLELLAERLTSRNVSVSIEPV